MTGVGVAADAGAPAEALSPPLDAPTAGDDPFAGLALDELEATFAPGLSPCSSEALAALNSMVMAGHFRLGTGP
jgi:hypothetical protein